MIRQRIVMLFIKWMNGFSVFAQARLVASWYNEKGGGTWTSSAAPD